MSGRLSGKSAIVIGAAQGIGEGIARLFAEEGARLVIGDRDEQTGRRTAEALSELSDARFVATDVSRKDDCEALVTAALDAYGQVDILIQNAGIYPWTLIEKIPVEEWDQVLGVNLRGTFLAAQACLAPMRAGSRPRSRRASADEPAAASRDAG